MIYIEVNSESGFRCSQCNRTPVDIMYINLNGIVKCHVCFIEEVWRLTFVLNEIRVLFGEKTPRRLSHIAINKLISMRQQNLSCAEKIASLAHDLRNQFSESFVNMLMRKYFSTNDWDADFDIK